MTSAEAEQLATVVADAAVGKARVEVDGESFIVVVETPTGTYVLWDEADWIWLRPRMASR